LEALHGDLVGDGPVTENLECDAAFEGDLFGFIDDAHAAAADLTEDAEVAELHGSFMFCRGGAADEVEAGEGFPQRNGEVWVLGEQLSAIGGAAGVEVGEVGFEDEGEFGGGLAWGRALR
jgi:hypothetical protein